MSYAIVLAVHSASLGIGFQGQLPWKLSADMKFFRSVTTGQGKDSNVVIMGRKTWDSLPARFKPLPERKNIILSRTLTSNEPGYTVCSDLNSAMASAAEHVKQTGGEIFVIGGASLFDNALQDARCTRILLTTVVSPMYPTDIHLSDRWAHLVRDKNGADLGFHVQSDGQLQTEKDTVFYLTTYARSSLSSE